MGRLLKYLIMFGPTLWSWYKKYTAKNSTASNLPQPQDPRNQPTSGTQEKGKWEFEEGQNPLG